MSDAQTQAYRSRSGTDAREVGLLDQIVEEGPLRRATPRRGSAARTWSRSSSRRCSKAR